MNEQELNKKLAEWAGFKVEQVRVQGLLDVLVYPPAGREYVGNLPNFTQSLDACFKWLIPEAIKKFGIMTTYYAACEAMYEAIGKKTFSTEKAIYDGKPALALCVAIEKLIDSEEKSSHQT